MMQTDDRGASIPSTMWGWVLAGKGRQRLTLQEMPVPRPGPEQILARVDAVNACASDLKILDQGSDHPLMGGWDVERYPIIPGHEASLTLVEVGERLHDRFWPGQRVVVQPALPTGPIGHRERYADPDRITKTSIGYTLPGFYAEYVLLTEEAMRTDSLLIVPEQVPHFAAACAEPLCCVLAAQQQHIHLLQNHPGAPRQVHVGLKSGGVALLLGAGPMGLMHIDAARLARPRALLVVEPNPARRQGAIERFAPLFAREEIELQAADPAEVGAALTLLEAPQGADDVIVAVGKAQVQADALRWVAPGGVLNLFGGTPAAQSQLVLDARRIHYDHVRVVGSSGGSFWDLAEAVRLMAEGVLYPEYYIGAVGGLDAAGTLLDALAAQQLEGKGVIYPARRAPLQAVQKWDEKQEQRYLSAS